MLTELGPEVWELLDDRLFEAIESGVIDPDYTDTEEGSVAPTIGELNTLRRILMREAFRELPRPRPCPHPPGSAAKLAEMERRAAAGESTTSPLDADPDADDRGGVEVIGTGKGSKVKVEVIGWFQSAPAG